MLKKAGIVLLIMLIVVLLAASCEPKPTTPNIKEKPVVEAPTTGEAPVDAVAEDISKVGNADEDLDTSELDDVDSILADIEKI